MKNFKVITTIEKSLALTVTNPLLSEKTGHSINLSKVLVMQGIQCWLKWYPNGVIDNNAGHVSVFLCVNNPVKVHLTFTLVGSFIKDTSSCFMPKNGTWGCSKFATHDEIQEVSKNGASTIICIARFEISFSLTDWYSSFGTHETDSNDVYDYELIVDEKIIKVDKHFLVAISSNLNAASVHAASKSQTVKVYTSCFDYKTVKSTTDFFYNRPFEDTPIKTIINVLRFLEMFNIPSKHLKQIASENITPESFCIIVQYAYDSHQNAMFDKCAKFFLNNVHVIKTQNDFKHLHGELLSQLIQKGYSFDSVFNILRYTCALNVTAATVRKNLETTLILTNENFCKAASYAWDCKRDNFQIKCALFLRKKKP